MIPFVAFGSRGRRLRFFGRSAWLDFHLELGAKLQDSACPGQGCPSCAFGEFPVTMGACLAWEVMNKKWVACVTRSFEGVVEECSRLGCTAEMMEAGHGPDVIVQGWGKATEVVALPETLGIPVMTTEIPDLEAQIGLLIKRSRYNIGKKGRFYPKKGGGSVRSN